MRVLVASFNVHSFRGGVDKAAGSLGEPGPAIVLLQECGPQFRLERFARARRSAALASGRSFGRMRNAIVFRSDWQTVGAPMVHEFERRGRAIPRGLVAVRLRGKAAELTAVSAHLGLSAEERARHVRELLEVIGGLRAPLVLGVDLNEGPEGNAARRLSERMTDAFAAAGRGSGATFPSNEPTARIDCLFAGAGIDVMGAWVARMGGSDHRAVLADLEI